MTVNARSCEKLKRKISFTESQSFEVCLYRAVHTTIVLPRLLAAIIVFIIIFDYLLIYNITISQFQEATILDNQNIRHDKRQIKQRIVRLQIFRTAISIQQPDCQWYWLLDLFDLPMKYDVLKRYRPWEIVSFSPLFLRVPAIFPHFYQNRQRQQSQRNSCKYFSVAASAIRANTKRSYRDHKEP